LVAAPEFVAAMGRHVASVCVITAEQDGKRFGLTATAVSSVSADPPRLLVCVNKSGASHEAIEKTGAFCVNVLTESQDRIAKNFAGMLGRDTDRFSIGEWARLVTGAPVLRGAVAAFDCRVAETSTQSSHTIFIGDVVAVAPANGQDPLLYGARRFRTLRKAFMDSGEAALESLHF
jgi:flavin reductase (DIM6/NTAB) family NADH-FMN oxidoreductase RutF